MDYKVNTSRQDKRNRGKTKDTTKYTQKHIRLTEEVKSKSVKKEPIQKHKEKK